MLMIMIALALQTPGVVPEDGLDELLTLPPPEVSVPLDLYSDEAGTSPRFRGNLGALMLMTAEGNFPVPILLTGDTSDVGEAQVDWRTDELLAPGPNLLYPSVVTTAAIEWIATSKLSMRTFLTSGEIRGGATLTPESEESVVMFGLGAEEFFRSGFWLAEAALTLDTGPLTIELGRRFTDIAGGLIYQDVGTGLFLTYVKPESDFSFHGSLYATGRDFDSLATPSPMAQAAIRYEWDWLSSFEVFAASYWSRDDALTDVIVSTLAEAVIISQPENVENVSDEQRQLFLDRFLTPLLTEDIGERARITYLGATLDGRFGKLKLKARFAMSRGSFETEDSLEAPLNSIEDLRVRIDGYAFDLDGSVEAYSSLTLGVEAMAFSGFQTESIREQEYNSFIAVAPLWTYSTIFFTSGVNQTFTAARGSAAGINGHGVIGGGPYARWTSESWIIGGKVLALFADEGIDPIIGGGGSFYGLEPNLTVSTNIGSGLFLRGIAGMLFPGSFFPEDDLAYRAVVILDGRYDL